jgi:hypothetical protein
MSSLTTTYLPWLPATALLGDPQENFSYPVTFLVLFIQLPLYLLQVYIRQ